MDRVDDGGHQGLLGFFVRSRNALVVDPHDLLNPADDTRLDARRPAGVGHEMGRADRLPLEGAAEFIGRTIRTDEADKHRRGAESRYIGRHVGGPARNDPSPDPAPEPERAPRGKCDLHARSGNDRR